MNSRERRTLIVEHARASGLASVAELAGQFAVSESTIRRDLSMLSQQNKLTRTYGGAMPRGHHPEASLRQRLGTAFAAKAQIGAWAAGQIEPGEMVMLDAGTTTAAMAQQLVDRDDITVATVGITVAQTLLDATGVELLILGGRLRRLSQGLVGPLAEAALESMTFDRAFLGADAVSAEYGICEAEPDQTRLKEIMMRRTEHVYVLAHASKLHERPFHYWARMPRQWTLVTDDSVGDGIARRFHDEGVTLQVAT